MSQVLKSPDWVSFHFHPNILNKEHRDNCPSCVSAFAGMDLYVKLIKESEAQVESS